MGLLIDAGDIEGAVPVVARARKFHVGDRSLDVMHARMLLRLGRRDESRAVIDGILAEDPGERQANLFLSRMAGDGDRRLANEAMKRTRKHLRFNQPISKASHAAATIVRRRIWKKAIAFRLTSCTAIPTRLRAVRGHCVLFFSA